MARWLRGGWAWVVANPRRTFKFCFTLVGLALLAAVLMQPIRERWGAAFGTACFAVVPLVVGPLMLADWRGMTTAWTDAFYPGLGIELPTGRSRRPLQIFQRAGTRFWGLLVCFLGLVFEVYGLVYLVRDLT